MLEAPLPLTLAVGAYATQEKADRAMFLVPLGFRGRVDQINDRLDRMS